MDEAGGKPLLEEPQGVCLDAAGNIYVSDRGTAHQVKVFSPQGSLLRTIGKPGVPSAGAYDPRHMNNPLGLTIDGRGRLWVAEEDFQPKRVSVWNPDGTLWRAFYGPAEYGGGGRIDPYDGGRFYYNGMEFRLDWRQGRDELVRVFDRRRESGPLRAFRAGMPETPVELDGRRYFTNCYNSNPTGGWPVVMIWLDRGGTVVPLAALGRADLCDLLKGDAFRARWPAGVDLTKNPWQNPALFAWSDLNGDGQVQPEEVTFVKASCGGVTVMPDLSFAVARVDDKAMRYPPLRFTGRGVPVYDLGRGEVLVEGAQNPPSSGGDQVLIGPDGWTIHTNAPRPFSPHGVGGARHGVALWSYPSLWPGLHASHEAPVPEQPGTIVGHTRLLGGFVTPAGEAGPLWLLNGNHGTIYVFTIDGLFVAQLFQDMRVGRQWAMPVARRGMLLNEVTLHDENFWPSVTQTPQGDIYLYSGGHQSIVRVDGLESVRRIAPQTLDVTVADLDRARQSMVRAEVRRQAARGKGVLVVALRTQPPRVDGRLDDWAGADWVDIDKRGVAAYFDSHSRPFDVTAAVAIAGDRLYAAWRTGDKDLLKNSGETPLALFKTGGALDLMIGCRCGGRSEADAARRRRRAAVDHSRGGQDPGDALSRGGAAGPRAGAFRLARADDPFRPRGRRQRRGRASGVGKRRLRNLGAAGGAWIAAGGGHAAPRRHRHPPRRRLRDPAPSLLEQQGHGDHRRRAQRGRAPAGPVGQVGSAVAVVGTGPRKFAEYGPLDGRTCRTILFRVELQSACGPKAQPIAQRRATPWKTEGKRMVFSAQRANRSSQASGWAVGPKDHLLMAISIQGVALRWAT